MRWAMEILPPNSSWFLDDGSKRRNLWTTAENKAFENALAGWKKVAARVPGKTVTDVIRQYKELEDDVSSIEAGLIPLPGYGGSSPFTLQWGTEYVCVGFKQHSSNVRKSLGQERKKGVPWTEEEHKLFVMGLEKYGKGDWRNISRNFVVTRTPTQVASHAQKYFIRQLSGLQRLT